MIEPIDWEVVNIYWEKYDLLIIGDFHEQDGRRYHLVDDLKEYQDGCILDNAVITSDSGCCIFVEGNNYE